MDIEFVWEQIDSGRTAFADLYEGLCEEQLQTPSLCAGWTVRDVGVHLTQAHASLGSIAWPLIMSGFSVTRMTRKLATSAEMSRPDTVTALRKMVGSRKTAIGVTALEPLLDILVHTQDVARPLGLEILMPAEAAKLAAERTFSYPGPLRFTRRYDDLTFVATDTNWQFGEGPNEVRGPIAELLLALTGRPAEQLTGSTDRLWPTEG